MKLSKKFLRKAEIYKIFAKPWDGLDFSDKSLQDVYEYESFGRGDISVKGFGTNNGYAVGKKWCDWQVNQWLSECKIFIDGEENRFHRGWYNVLNDCYTDPDFKDHHWWLDKIFKDYVKRYKQRGGTHGSRNFRGNQKELT